MNKIKSLLIIIFFLFTFENSIAQWSQSLGPETGDITSIIYTDTSIYIGCTNFGGIFKSNNMGNNWSPVGNINLNKKDIRSMILKENVLYAGNINGIIKSTNGGASWTDSYSGSTIGTIAFNDNYIFAGKSNGIIVSSDNGNSWIPSNNGLTNNFIQIIRTNGNDIYAGTFSGIFKSSNNGINWNLISPSLQNVINDLLILEDTILAAVSGLGIYISTNEGINWQNISQGIPYTNPIALSKENNRIIASFYSGGIYYTPNTGNAWFQANIGLRPLPIVNTLVSKNNITLAGSFGNGFYTSLTNQLSWSIKNTGLVASSVSSLEKCNRGLLAGTNKGVFISSNGGGNWESAGHFMECNYVTEIKKAGENIYAGTKGGCGMMKSTDEGLTWTPINNGLSSNIINGITIYENEEIFAATNSGIHNSNNYGSSWSIINTLPVTDFFSVQFLDSVLYAASYNTIYKSTNLGINWISASNGIPAASGINSFEKIGNKIFAAGNMGVFQSTNNGVSWNSANAGLGDTFINSLISIGDYLVLSTVFTGNYYSSNEGQSWLPLNGGLSSKTISLYSMDSLLFAGTQGNGVYNLNFKTVNIKSSSDFILNGFELYQNYPNPFNSSTKISFYLPSETKINLKVFDMLGREVLSLIDNEYKRSGTHSIFFNGSNLSSGLYLYSLDINKHKITNRMVLIK